MSRPSSRVRAASRSSSSPCFSAIRRALALREPRGKARPCQKQDLFDHGSVRTPKPILRWLAILHVPVGLPCVLAAIRTVGGIALAELVRLEERGTSIFVAHHRSTGRSPDHFSIHFDRRRRRRDRAPVDPEQDVVAVHPRAEDFSFGHVRPDSRAFSTIVLLDRRDLHWRQNRTRPTNTITNTIDVEALGGELFANKVAPRAMQDAEAER